MSILKEIGKVMEEGDAAAVAELTKKCLDEGMDAREILQEGLLAPMDSIGTRFKAGEMFVPEVLIAAQAMSAGMDILRPILSSSNTASAGKCVLGTVEGDLHDIGKNLVKMIMESKGIEVIDLGYDVKPEVYINTALENDCKIIAMSAMLTSTATVMQKVIALAEERGVRDKFKFMIGGAPVNADYAAKIGADAWTLDAVEASEKAVEFCLQ